VCITYNHEKFIGQALESFVMQETKYPFEVIISDDCSTDNTAKIIAEYANKYPAVIKPIFRQKNLGIEGNFLETLSLANTEYVLYCEGDDYFDDPLKIEKQLNFLEKNPDFTICFHPVTVICEHLSITPTILPDFSGVTNKEEILRFAYFLLNGNYMQTNSVMYRWLFRGNKKIEDVFPENIMPLDYFLHLFHSEKGKIGFIDDAMSTYRLHPGGVWIDSLNNEDAIRLKYGEKQLNFFVQAAKIFLNNSEEYRKKAVYPLATELLLLFLQFQRLDKIQQLISLCPDEYETAVTMLYNGVFNPVNK
jgi:glycosyltransferase involved in cell wall biosynthesis